MKTYYYIGASNQQEGPFSAEEIKTKINLSSMVWTEGMANWAPASTVPELAALLSQPQPPFGQQPPYSQPPFGQQQQFGQQQFGGQQPFGQQNQFGGGFNNTQNMQGKPDNFLVWAILSIVLCCWPLGIVAVIYAAKVNNLWAQGRYNEAVDAANKAKNYTLASAILGVICIIIGFIVGITDGLF